MKSNSGRLAAVLLAVGLLSAHPSRAATPALDGTVSDQALSNWTEWKVGGIQNTSTSARDWLLALPAQQCSDTSSCGVYSTFKGGASGTSTSIGYAVGWDGFFTAATPLWTQGGNLAEIRLGTLAANEYVLLVTHLAGASTSGGTDGGGMTTGKLN